MAKNRSLKKHHQHFSKAINGCNRELIENAPNLLDFKGYEVEQYSYIRNTNSTVCQAVTGQTNKIGTIQNV